MIKQDNVGIYNKTGTKDEYGGWTDTPSFIKTIDVDIQPYSTQLLLNQYGYKIEVNKRIFIDFFEPDIKVGTILRHVNKQGKNVDFEVKVIPWDDIYMEVICFGI